MGSKKIRFVIDSDLANVSLVGMAVHKICSEIPLSDMESYSIELCVVEAVNNSIIHAYDNKRGNSVEINFVLHSDRLILEICDEGTSMTPDKLDQRDVFSVDPDDIESIPEGGRGLAIIKEVMDSVAYRTEDGKNYFTLMKKIDRQA
ncbi:MAG: ATP-binding protein [Syntrophaceae bacterium]|nr:ATP-binding protein [Syntrophaceae bacterium]